MDGVWLQLGLVALLVLVNAAFAGSELALVSLRDGQLKRLERNSANGATLARLARDPNRFLATIQIGITLAGFLASASAAVALAEPLEEPLGFLGGAAEAAAIVLVTVILAYFTLVVGELAPKRLAMQRAERWGLLVARPLSALATAARPVVWLLSRSTDVVVRVLGGNPNRERELITHEELRDLVALQASFSDHQRRIIDGAFEISERTLREVLQPRADVFVIDAGTPCAEALADLAAAGHSRAPVAPDGDIDAVTGIVHFSDLFTDDPSITAGTVANSPTVFPEAFSVLDTLREMQMRRVQLAMVINEHGSAEGLVTMEDLMEELVGEIYDETDRDVLGVRHEPGGAMVLPGRYPIHDLTDLGIDVPEGVYTTVAGLILDRLGHLPNRGESAEVNGWRFTVRATERRAITETSVVRVETETDGLSQRAPDEAP